MDNKESDIILRSIRGDEKAMNTLYAEHERHWFRLCLRYSRNRDEAQDILQEGLMMIFRDLHQFDVNKGEFMHWSNRVLVNAALRFLKKTQWQQSFDDIDIITGKEVEFEGIIDRISAKELIGMIQSLPAGYRMVFNMFELEGFAHKEIAEHLNISVGTSKSQLSKAKKLLKQKVELAYKY